jgi:FkbM family methyltransferase
LDILFINSLPKSGQYQYNKNEWDHIITEYSKTHKVATTLKIDNIACIDDYNLSLFDLSSISMHCKYIVAVNTGPFCCCLNKNTINNVTKCIYLGTTDKKHLLNYPNFIRCISIQEIKKYIPCSLSNVSDFLQYCYDENFENKCILECGAHQDGRETMNILSNDKYYIECNPEDYNVLKNKVKNAYNFALHDYNGIVPFTVTSWPGNSSINHGEKHIKELKSYGASFNTINIECITYKYFIEEIIKKHINVLVLDVGGNELTILKSFKLLREEQLPEFLVIECGYDWEERKKVLDELNYQIDFYQYNNCYLTQKCYNIKKNMVNIDKTNNNNKIFVWNGYTIYSQN